MARYFKVAPGSYGEGDVFIGIKLDRRCVSWPSRTSHRRSKPIGGCRCCVARSTSIGMIALVVMSERASKSAKKSEGAAELQLIYDTYLDNTRWVNNWDLVDVSCRAIVGELPA